MAKSQRSAQLHLSLVLLELENWRSVQEWPKLFLMLWTAWLVCLFYRHVCICIFMYIYSFKRHIKKIYIYIIFLYLYISIYIIYYIYIYIFKMHFKLKLTYDVFGDLKLECYVHLMTWLRGPSRKCRHGTSAVVMSMRKTLVMIGW